MADSYFARFQGKYMREATTRPLASGSKPKINLVLGARQTGKSTLLEHCIPAGDQTFVLNLQDRRQRRRYESDEGLLVRELQASPEIETVFIDEIQRVPTILDDIQFLYDREPRKRRFFLTGSSARKLKRKSANLLPGRMRTRLVSPVLQAELRETELLPLPMVGAPRFPQRSLEDHLLFGSLPGLHHEEPDEWRETLAAYVDLYIENEIRQENIVEDMGAFVRFLRLAALESGQCVNFTKLATAVGVATNTLRNFYQVLEDTYIGVRINAFGRSRKRTLQAPRFLLFDLGVRHTLAELPLGDTLLKLDAGHIFEQWVLAEIYYRCACLGREYKLSTWQTATGSEVDAVVETPGGVIPVEVKWTDHPSPRDARHVETFLNQHADMSAHGYVVCRCPRKQKLTDRVTALPWDRF